MAESRRFRGLVWRLAAPLFAPIWPTLRPGVAGRLVLPMGCAKGRSRSCADESKRHWGLLSWDDSNDRGSLACISTADGKARTKLV